MRPIKERTQINSIIESWMNHKNRRKYKNKSKMRLNKNTGVMQIW